MSGRGDELFAGDSYYCTFAQVPSWGWMERVLSARAGGDGGQPHFIGEHEQTVSRFPTVLSRAVRERLSKKTVGFRPMWHEDLLADLAAVHDPLRRVAMGHQSGTMFTRCKQGWVLPMHRWLKERRRDAR